MRSRCRQHRLVSVIFLVCSISLIWLLYRHTDSQYLIIPNLFSSVTDDSITSSGWTSKVTESDYAIQESEIVLSSEVVNKTYSLNFSQDVLVFLHIQKTAGTYLGGMIVNELDVTKHGAKMCKCQEGKRKCDCRTDHGYEWIFSRYSTGWRCGLHADWTELSACVENEMNRRERTRRKRNYYYLTFLREPTHRYVSEFLHVQRGATWKTAKLFCGGHSASEDEWPRCFTGPDWRGVDLETFATCRTNLATNRQTRMLADLRLVHCYNTSAMSGPERSAMMLRSACSNLERFAYFGLTEFLSLSQYLFEATFAGLRFRVAFAQTTSTHSHNALSEFEFDSRSQSLIADANRLDDQLYTFASRLFFARLRVALLSDATFRRERELYETLRDAHEYELVRELAVSLTDHVHRRFLRTRDNVENDHGKFDEPEGETDAEYEDLAAVTN